MAYYSLGRRAESDAALARMIKEQGNNNAFEIAEAYAYRGERDLPLKNLESDPRYEPFLRTMNLPI